MKGETRDAVEVGVLVALGLQKARGSFLWNEVTRDGETVDSREGVEMLGTVGEVWANVCAEVDDWDGEYIDAAGYYADAVVARIRADGWASDETLAAFARGAIHEARITHGLTG